MEELFGVLFDIITDIMIFDTFSGKKRSSNRLPKTHLPKPKLPGVSDEAAVITAGLAGAGVYLWHKHKHPDNENRAHGSHAEKILSEREQKQARDTFPVIK